jgi:hypothetical protein
LKHAVLGKSGAEDEPIKRANDRNNR